MYCTPTSAADEAAQAGLTAQQDLGIIKINMTMNIRPSAAIRQNYNEISELCKKTAEPVYLTKNGEGDLVVMDIEAFTRREKML